MGTKSQSGATKSFRVATITHPPIRDSSSNTSLSQEDIIVVKAQNPVEVMRMMVKSHGMNVDSRSSSSYDADNNLNEDSACLLVEQLKAYSLRDNLFQVLEQDPSIEYDIKKLLRNSVVKNYLSLQFLLC